MTPVATQRKPKRSPRPRIDWTAAFAFFVVDPARSFGKVAREFGVSDTAVRKHAKAEKWEERVAAIDERTAARSEAKAEITLERTRTLALEVGSQLLDELNKIEKAKEVKPSDYAGVVKTLMLAHGEATDVIGIAEAADQHRALLRLVKPFIPEKQWPAVLDAIEQSMGEAA